MPLKRPIALTIAGFDPSGGAGLLADIKVFEQLEVYGLGVCTAITSQNDSEFFSLTWTSNETIQSQLRALIEKFAITVVKIGIFRELSFLNELILKIKSHSIGIKIVLDPVLKASAGYDFHDELDVNELAEVLKNITLLTPNYNEWCFIKDVLACDPSSYCSVLLKGGHNPEKPGIDILYSNDETIELEAGVKHAYPKHGSGCVLSSAIAAFLAKGHSLQQACLSAKRYTETFLNSNPSLLGYHKL